jgi:tetratricopeptide (TPR) repeat protein
MIAGLWRAIKGSILYVKAGTSLDLCEYETAKRQIEKASELLDYRLSKPGLFAFHLRAAEIYYRLGDLDKAAAYVFEASNLIKKHSKLDASNRNYLLDYCDRMLDDMDVPPESYQYRIHKDDYDQVSKQYLTSYPVVWTDVN